MNIYLLAWKTESIYVGYSIRPFHLASMAQGPIISLKNVVPRKKILCFE